MIKLLALDLDGTTLNSKGQIPDANRAAIHAAEERGVLVTIATGRRFRDAQLVGIELALNAPLITHNGALLKFADTQETVAFSPLSNETSLEIIRLGKVLGYDAFLSTDPHGLGKLLYDRVPNDNLPLQRYIRWSQSLHGDEGAGAIVHVPSLVDILHEHEVVHASFSGICAEMHGLEMSLREELAGRATILATIYPRSDFTLLDILPPDASKGHGVAKIAELNGIAREDVMAMGDNFNDLEMLEYAGTAVVMGNADPSLLEREEFYTTLSNDENGVAVAIKKFILEM